jgi:NAD(P) transhydrogenase subunit beta
MTESFAAICYLAAAVCFIVGLKMMSTVPGARRGNAVGAFGMVLAIAGTLVHLGRIDFRWILAGGAVGSALGAWLSYRVPMTAMPQFVAFFNGLGGLASALVALCDLLRWLEGRGDETLNCTAARGFDWSIALVASLLVGAVTFTGSMLAYLKLEGRLRRGEPILLPGRHVLNGALFLAALVVAGWLGSAAASRAGHEGAAIAIALAGGALGWLLVLPIGGADMPVVISLLNSYSGIAAATTGFVLNNDCLIVSGALVGASGIFLTQIMCRAMNRSLANVLLGGFGVQSGGEAKKSSYTRLKSCTAEDAAPILDGARSVVFVPGYGLAVSQGQHAIRELADRLEARGTRCRYAIHPVAGRMPGHMNVLLAEANVPYEKLVEMEQINPDFRDTDVAIVVGANDVVNPVARTQKGSPIYGMPILDVDQARTVLVIKRSLSPGFAGIDNPLFEADNALLVFADAKEALLELAAHLKK